MSNPSAYSGFLLCPELIPDYRCIRLRKYNSGSGPAYDDLFHEHIPKHRVSEDAAVELLRALVLVYSGAEAPSIVRSHLNGRGHEPPRDTRLRIAFEYPEPGVMRKYCGTDVHAWIDTVLKADHFRKRDEGTAAHKV